MRNSSQLNELFADLSGEAQRDLEKFLNFSEVRTGQPESAERKLLETLSLTYSFRHVAN